MSTGPRIIRLFGSPLGGRDDAVGELALAGEDLLGEVEIGIDDLGGSGELLGELGQPRDLVALGEIGQLRGDLVGGLGPGGDRVDGGILRLRTTSRVCS